MAGKIVDRAIECEYQFNVKVPQLGCKTASQEPGAGTSLCIILVASMRPADAWQKVPKSRPRCMPRLHANHRLDAALLLFSDSGMVYDIIFYILYILQ